MKKDKRIISTPLARQRLLVQILETAQDCLQERPDLSVLLGLKVLELTHNEIRSNLAQD
jgi:hypothetical protein